MVSTNLILILALVGCIAWPQARGPAGAAQSVLKPRRLYALGGGAPTDSIVFSPSGAMLATGSEDHTAKIWDLPTGRLRRTLRSAALTVGWVAFSPDGRTLATGNSDGTVKLWAVASGRLERTLPGVYGPVAYSPDGRLLAAVGENWVRLWDTRSWKVVATLQGARVPPGPLRASVWIWQIAIAPDGKSLAAVEHVSDTGDPSVPQDFVQLWSTATWHVRRCLRQPIASQIQVAFSPDSRRLAVVGGWIYRGNVLLWDLSTGRVRRLVSDLEESASSIVYDPHGRWVAFASEAGARIVDVASGKMLLVVKVGGAAFGSGQLLAVSPDGRLLAAIRQDGAVEIWRLPADLGGASAAAAAKAPAPPHAGAAP